ncbi:MAG TPA: membrane dipeptidase, partial [bacterium]|nr:membrane dipeptidase [bacterium]
DGKPDAATPVETVIRHIDYIARRIGIDHVALGSDFNGALIPAELGDVMGLLRLIRALEDQGFSPEEIRKITSENWLRVLGRTWKDGM